MSNAQYKLWIVALTLMIGCGGSATGPQALMSDEAVGRLALTPFPSDAYFVDGKVAIDSVPLLQTDTVEAIRSAIVALNGFPTTSSAFFPVDVAVDVATDATADLVDLATNTVAGKWPLSYRSDFKHIVAIIPRGFALAPNHAYAIVVTDGVTALGAPLRPSKVMQDALSAHGRYAQIDSYQKLAAYLKTLPKKALAATAFTTHNQLSWFAEVSADLDNTPPAIVIERVYKEADLDGLMGTNLENDKPGLQPAGGTTHDAVGWVILGHMTGPNFLPQPNDPDAAAIAVNGTLTRRGEQTITWAMCLPKAMSYANTRVVHFQHGLGSNRANVMAVCNEPAKRGFATFAIDTLYHGDRLPGAVDNEINATRQPGHDGFADIGGGMNSILDFFAIEGDKSNNLPAADMRLMRDNFRQASVDIMAAIRFEKHGDLAAIQQADPLLADLSFDATKLAYTGESLGSILGAIVLAQDPELEAAVLDVGGGGLALELITSSPSFAPMFGPLSGLFIDATVDLTQAEPSPRGLMSLNLAQGAIELGDGLALGSLLTPNKHAILLEAKDDEIVPNHSNEALASAFGMKQLMVADALPTLYVDLPSTAVPYVASPMRALVQIANSTHTQYSLQQDTQHFIAPWPPFVSRNPSLTIVHPIQRVRDFALDFIDSYVAGNPTVVDHAIP